jgi:membrane-associated protease RseP (regulator of RpoE activity)
MQPQQKSSGSGFGSADQSGAIVCGQCGAPMPTGMRFCRTCGNRLGEGPAEYTETVRLSPGANAANAQFKSQYAAGMGGPMARQSASSYLKPRRRLGFSGMTWIWIVLGLFFASGGLLSSLRLRAPRPGAAPAASFSSTRSYVGVEQLKTSDGGVTFDLVAPPDSPADKAGLVGGDIITSFDGHAVASDGQMMDLLEQTPVGKTVEVVYLRDGLTKKTLMTTISEAAFDQLKQVFNNRPEGKGVFGFERDRTERISNPETKTYGVRIDWVDPNGPADLFGIKEGDIITDFDKAPIRTSEELLSRVRRAIPKSVVEVGLLRDGQALKIPMTMGRGR